jgi:hypothetical protein
MYPGLADKFASHVWSHEGPSDLVDTFHLWLMNRACIHEPFDVPSLAIHLTSQHISTNRLSHQPLITQAWLTHPDIYSWTVYPVNNLIYPGLIDTLHSHSWTSFSTNYLKHLFMPGYPINHLITQAWLIHPDIYSWMLSSVNHFIYPGLVGTSLVHKWMLLSYFSMNYLKHLFMSRLSHGLSNYTYLADTSWHLFFIP